MAYYTSRQTMLEMFTDATPGETYQHNRLITQESDNGTVELIGYGWLKIAEYDESNNHVTVFTGHRSLESKTVGEWLNEVVRVAENRGRTVSLQDDSPKDGQPNDGTKFINNYISFKASKSAVEKDAQNEVVDSLRHVR
jgi:hypothetical protein